MSDKNVEMIEGAYAAFGRGDIPAILEVLSDDIEWHAPAVLPQGMDTVGKDGVTEFFGKVAESWGGLHVELDSIVASGDRVCAIGRAAGELDGSHTGYRFVHAWTIDDGLCARFDEYADPAPEVAAAALATTA
jgi:ketosteroid isomerase-like protein